MIRHLRKKFGGKKEDKATKRQSNKATKQQQIYSDLTMTEAMMQSKIHAEQMFQKFEDNTISLVFAKNKNDVEKQRECEGTERKIINNLLDGSVELYDFFMLLFIAEYKDRTYWSVCDIHFDRIESDILAEYKRIFSKNCIWDSMAKSHIHDPKHIVFEGKHYHFYDMLECNGYNILTMTEDEICDALYSKYDD
jgi:hypothetical protein